MKKFREFEAWSLRVNPLIKPKKINWPDAWKCPLSSITLLRLVHSFFPFQDKSYYPLAWQVFLVNSSHHKALFILIRCTKGKRERAVAKKLSASRKTWAFPRHRFISIFQPREKGENLKGCRRAKCMKKRNSLFLLQNQNKGIHNYQCSFEHSFNTYAPVRLRCFSAQIRAALLGTTKHRWDLFPARVDLPAVMQNTDLLKKPCPSNVTREKTQTGEGKWAWERWFF